MVRDDRGRFVKGITGNPNGRPRKDREVEYYRILINACTPDDWEAIIDKAIEQAKRGDSVARQFLADYLVGAPETNINLKGKGGFDIHVIYENKPKPKTTDTA